MTQRPDASEYAPYYEKYVSLVPVGNIVETLETQLSETLGLLANVPEERGDFRYGPGKWTLRESIGHVSDTERVFAYRMLRISRGDQTPMTGFDQDKYVLGRPTSKARIQDLAQEFDTVRRATLSLLQQFDPEAWTRRGTANGMEVSTLALAYITAGHELHHRAIFRDKYLAAAS